MPFLINQLIARKAYTSSKGEDKTKFLEMIKDIFHPGISLPVTSIILIINLVKMQTMVKTLLATVTLCW